MYVKLLLLKFINYIILLGLFISYVSVLSQSDKTVRISKIHLSYSYGCLDDIDSEITLIPEGTDWTVLYKEETFNKNLERRGKIPSILFANYYSALVNANLFELNNEYICEMRTTGEVRGYLKLYIAKGDSVIENQIRFISPENCENEISDIFRIIRKLKYFAISSLSSIQSENPWIQKDAVYILGDATGLREIRKDVIQSHSYYKNKKELTKAILKLQKQNIDTLAKAWWTNSNALEYTLEKALRNINEMEE